MSMKENNITEMLTDFFKQVRSSTPKVAALNWAYVIELTDRPGLAWTIDYRDFKGGAVHSGRDPSAVATFKMPEAALQDIASDPAGARRLMRRRFRDSGYTVDGDLELAERFRRILSPNP